MKPPPYTPSRAEYGASQRKAVTDDIKAWLQEMAICAMYAAAGGLATAFLLGSFK